METYPEVSIGTAVRKLRELKQISQSDLAEKAGISQQYISKLESDETDPAFSKVEAIAKALGVRISELTGIVDKTVNIKVENSHNSQGYVSGTFNLTVQHTIPNEERELYKKTIEALESENKALKTVLHAQQVRTV